MGLEGIEIAMDLEKEFGICIEVSDWDGVVTVGDLCEMVR